MQKSYEIKYCLWMYVRQKKLTKSIVVPLFWFVIKRCSGALMIPPAFYECTLTMGDPAPLFCTEVDMKGMFTGNPESITIRNKKPGLVGVVTNGRDGWFWNIMGPNHDISSGSASSCSVHDKHDRPKSINKGDTKLHFDKCTIEGSVLKCGGPLKAKLSCIDVNTKTTMQLPGKLRCKIGQERFECSHDGCLIHGCLAASINSASGVAVGSGCSSHKNCMGKLTATKHATKWSASKC